MPVPITTLRDITVPYKRLMNATSAQVDLSGVTAKASFLVKRPEDAWQFVRDVAGVVRNVGGPGTPLATRIPLTFPENTDLFACGASITYAGARQWPQTGGGVYSYTGPSGLGPLPYGYAKVDVDFKYYLFNFSGGDNQFLSLQIRSAGNFYTIPYRVYQFADGTQTGADIGFLVPEQEIAYTRYWLPSLSYITPTIYACSGRVNSTPFGPDMLPAGTVLFIGGDSTQNMSVAGQQSNDVQMSFRYRYIKWNNFMHPNGVSGFQPIFDGSGNSPFPSTDLNVLLNI